MSHLALFLVLIAACMHASWNFLAKRAGNSPGFVWLFNLTGAVIYLPVLLFVLSTGLHTFTWLQGMFLIGTGCLHLGYFLFLQRGYAAGDLSLSYPLARGAGPLLSTTLAIAFLGERPAAGSLAGIILLIAGVISLLGNPLHLFAEGKIRGSSVGYALLTGVFIAAYTLWDKEAVSRFMVPPLLLLEASSLLLAGFLLPAALKNWQEVKATWKSYRLEVLGVAILSPLAYLLILFVLISNPVSQVAPLRESSVLIGTFMGARFLAEKHGWHRLASAALILAGIILLAVSS